MSTGIVVQVATKYFSVDAISSGEIPSPLAMVTNASLAAATICSGVFFLEMDEFRNDDI